MKQHITKQQWDELSDNEKTLFKDGVDDYRYVEKKKKNAIPVVQIFNRVILSEELPTIGQMIEFLGDEIKNKYIKAEKGDYYSMKLVFQFVNNIDKEMELCDILWEACVYKLRNK